MNTTMEKPRIWAVRWCLRITVALQCAGYVAGAQLGEGPIFEFLWLTLDLSEATAVTAAEVGGWALLAAGVAILFVRSSALLYGIAGWFLASAAAEMQLGGAPFAHLALLSHSVRFLVPMALALFEHERTGDWGPAQNILKFGVGIVFITHGWEALQQHPRFVDYLLMAARRAPGLELAESTATTILQVIGVVDILVGLAVLLGVRSRVLLLYVAAWGTIAAFARMVHGGFWQFPDTLIRAANGGAALGLYFRYHSISSAGKQRDTHERPS